MRKFSLLGSVLATGLLICSCAAEIDLEEAAMVTSGKTPAFGDNKMYYTSESDNWLPVKVTPYNATEGFYWGINGHPITQHDYDHTSGPDTTLDDQLDLIEELGMNYYRVDIVTDANGAVIDNLSAPSTPGKVLRFDALLNKAAARQRPIKILPMVGITGLDVLNDTDIQAYNKGYNIGYGFASTYGSRINVYEVGNEEEIDPRTTNGGRILEQYDGDEAGHYTASKMQKLASYFKGAIAGIKAGDNNSTTKVIINNAGWIHQGFFKYFLNTPGYTVPFDYYGLHWYSNMGKVTDIANGDGRQLGNMYNILSNLTSATRRKDIWLTEVNRNGGSYPSAYSSNDPKFNYLIDPNPEINQAKWVQEYMREINNQNIKAFFIHELFDMTTTSQDADRKFGVYNKENSYKKPVFKTIKFFIEEQRFGYQDYIHRLHILLNHQTLADNSPAITSWSNILIANQNKRNTVKELMKEKYYGFVVDGLFQNLLDRTYIDPGARSYWENRLKNGEDRETIIMDFYHGDEFWTLSGSTNTGFINRLFLKSLNRNPTSTERTQWVNKFATKTKGQIITEMLALPEYYEKFIIKQYNELYNRTPSAEGLAHWKTQMINGVKQNEFVILMLILNECWEKSIIDGYDRRNAGTYTFE